MFDRFLEMFQNITISSVIVVVLILVAIILVAVLIARARVKRNRRPAKNKRHEQVIPISHIKSVSSQPVNITAPEIREKDKWASLLDSTVNPIETLPSVENFPPEEAEEKELEETGDYPAYIVKLDGSLDYDIIHQALGDVFTAEPSMPKSGSCYFVKEVVTGVYEAYDPRTAPLASDLTPVKAWFATHWDIVRQVFSVPTPWYKSISLWIAAITGILAFIIVLATIGG